MPRTRRLGRHGARAARGHLPDPGGAPPLSPAGLRTSLRQQLRRADPQRRRNLLTVLKSSARKGVPVRVRVGLLRWLGGLSRDGGSGGGASPDDGAGPDCLE